MTTRPATPSDSAAIGDIAEAVGLFPGEMTVEMMAPGLAGEGDLWRVAEEGGVQGFAFAREEELTDRTWNILAIGVAPEAQGRGLGRALIDAVETAADWRMIIIETTQHEAQRAARALYRRQGYAQEAHISGFYGEGDDKIVFVKRKAAP